MDTAANRVFGPRFMLAMFLAAFATFAQAQEGADYELEPGVQTSPTAAPDRAEDPAAGLEPAVDTSETFEPAVTTSETAAPAAVLAADVRREASSGQVMDRLELGRTEITGNQELPKVLYIVPWQKSDPGDLMGRPVNTLIDEVLAPLDREEFVRQVEYYDDLYRKE